MQRSENMTNHQLREHICNALTKGFRLDGRKMDEFRPLTIKTDCIRTAQSTPSVHFG